MSRTLKLSQKILLVIAGTISLVIGIVGAFLPILPTTPFVLLAAVCYLRSSQRLYERLMQSRFASKHVHNVLAGKGVPLSVKVLSLSVSAVMIGYVCVAGTDSTLVRALLGLLFVVQFVFMIRIRTLRPHDKGERVGTGESTDP